MNMYEVKYESCESENMQLVAANSEDDAINRVKRFLGDLLDKVISVTDYGDMQVGGYTYSGVLINDFVPIF